MADVFLQLSAEDRRDALGVVADRSGMGEGIARYNEALGEVTRAIYTANGMHEMLSSNAGPT